ncbi:hypothetical protein KQX54_005701 [Cotesia glomerata]|uniref:Uncharacterized protein n=1 Tax=Cotesia glomerata TaxID=32391 RepID=A0AAV7ID58_COTGL|nr:hypothetical protein KQX54_005701 [Cotesia glomerata]
MDEVYSACCTNTISAREGRVCARDLLKGSEKKNDRIREYVRENENRKPLHIRDCPGDPISLMLHRDTAQQTKEEQNKRNSSSGTSPRTHINWVLAAGE